MVSFLTESTKGFEPTETIGAFRSGTNKNSFDNVFESVHDQLMGAGLDVKLDVNQLIKNDAVRESYISSLLKPLEEDSVRFESVDDASRYADLYDMTKTMLDNCVADFITESTRVGQLLPIKAVDFPIIIKQNLSLATKDIIQTEVTKSPVIKKHIERRWIVDEKTGKRFEYPQCFFKDEYKEIFKGGKGFALDEKWIPLVPNSLFNWSIPANLVSDPAMTDPTREKISFDTKIFKVRATYTYTDPEDGTTKTVTNGEIPVDMRINMSDNRWLGGEIYAPETGELIDVVQGSVDFVNNTITLTNTSGKVNAVMFRGYLSNEYNERTVTFDRTREEFEWKIEDGFRADVPYSLEELEDSKALLDIDLYKLTYDDLTDLLVQMEDSKILEFLDDEYAKYQGIDLDPLGFNSFIREQTFDCDSSTQTVALQSEYIQKMLKFYVDSFAIDILDSAKIEDMTFVCYGNPRYIRLLDPEVNWIIKSGDSVGGVKVNYSYGIMNTSNVKIQVVSTMKYPNTDARRLRFIPYPLNDTQFTFKHYKYTTHILTAQNSGYRAANRPGGSATYLMGTTRNTSASIQGIQGAMKLTNTPFILNK